MKNSIKPNILIADDIEDNLLLLESILEPFDVNLITAQSGSEAIEKIRNTEIALALIDVKMPRMSGTDLAHRLQHDESRDTFPIIFVTAYAKDEPELRKCYESGAVDFILKPVDKRILKSKVKVFLELHRQKQQIEEQKIALESLVNELKNSNQKIQVRLSYENLLARISKMAVSNTCATDFFDKSIAEIGTTIKASRTYIIKYCSSTETLCNTHEWCAKDVKPQKENLKAIPVSGIPWWHTSLLNGQTLIYNNIEDIPEQASKEILKAQDILSVLAVPLFTNGKYFGHVGIDFCNEYRKWNKNDIVLLVSISRILSSVIERNIAEAEIMKKVETEHALINATLDSVFVIETDGTIVSHNNMMAQRLKHGQEELIGKNVFDLLPDKIASFRRDKVEEVARTGLPLRFQDKRDCYYFEHSLYPIKNSGGAVYRVAIFGHDITRKIQAEKALRDSEKMYRTLLSASPQGIFILDMKRKISKISDITVEIFGASGVNDFIGKDFFSFIPQKDADKLRTILSKTLSDGVVQNEELILEKKNKSRFFGEISATLVQDKDGSPMAYMIIVRDISQKKIFEQQLIRSERMVSLGEMASGMAHEINQPLLSMQLGIENLLNKIGQIHAVDDNYLSRKSEKIFEDIGRIGHIIDHVRSFSRDQEYIHSTFSLNDCIRNAVSMIGQQFKNHGINIAMHLDDSIGTISGNTYRLEQVLLNLLTNAKDAIEEKAGEMHVDFDANVSIAARQNKDEVVVEITDNGCGINNQDIDRIMLPFFTTKEIGKGTGLGLSISFSIIKELNGTIEVESQKNIGSTFRVKLPNK
ncbi:MAG: PAS domain S-box protein [Bacteroidales bacterium]|nr:PAS domain S-box protein [Bacteroidales bacterium]